MIDPQTLAKEIHEASTMNPGMHPGYFDKWDELADEVRKVRQRQAEYLMSKFSIFSREEAERAGIEKAELEKRVEKMGKAMSSLLISLLTGEPPQNPFEGEPKPASKVDEALQPYTRRSDRPFVDMAEQAGVTMRDEED